ncbi:NrfD/PsrC family molybdoenzyme membrane anchor subunit [Adlercreutzia sp. R7]|uniref:NrfD/PsrC family molybdoenzyme membrane anchor subunit n=1 Tax=Adlercreutzia wanghongyangiae TaxID=3111451 RepID=A0ABU6IJN3_9ACTN|nr:NrfD/PsrC family molybdoenzyme membrane anchor subunit [Adlercreutzia sp. R7]
MFSELVVAYLFLGGTGAGTCAVTAVLGLAADGEEMRRAVAVRFRDDDGRLYGEFFGTALIWAIGALVLGMICLMADVGRPDRLLLLAAAGPTSYLAVGAWALCGCLLLAGVLVLAWRGLVPASLLYLRALCGLLLAAAVITAAYTGLLLADMASVPLWHSPWLPPLFVVSSLSCGVALVQMSASFGRAATAFRATLRVLIRVDGLLIVAEAAVLAAWLASVWAGAGAGLSAGALTATDQAALASAHLLLEGSCAPLFWLGLVGVGLAVPFVADVVMMRGVAGGRSCTLGALSFRSALLGSAFCVLVGGVCLRAAVVAAAVLPTVAAFL